MTKFLDVLTIYMGNREIPVGKSNGSRHSVCKVSENIGCDGDAIFALLLVCLIDLNLFCRESYSHPRFLPLAASPLDARVHSPH